MLWRRPASAAKCIIFHTPPTYATQEALTHVCGEWPPLRAKLLYIFKSCALIHGSMRQCSTSRCNTRGIASHPSHSRHSGHVSMTNSDPELQQCCTRAALASASVRASTAQLSEQPTGGASFNCCSGRHRMTHRQSSAARYLPCAQAAGDT